MTSEAPVYENTSGDGVGLSAASAAKADHGWIMMALPPLGRLHRLENRPLFTVEATKAGHCRCSLSASGSAFQKFPAYSSLYVIQQMISSTCGDIGSLEITF